MFDSAAHAHRILAILEAGDIMTPIEGYSCFSCSTKTLYKENFTEQETESGISLFCDSCISQTSPSGQDEFSNKDKERLTEQGAKGGPRGVSNNANENIHDTDRGQIVREAAFLLDSEASSFLFGDAQAFLDANDAKAYGGEEFQSNPLDNFLVIFDDINNITSKQSLGEEDPANSADVVKETSYWLDSAWLEPVDFLPQENNPLARSPREEYIKDAMFMLGDFDPNGIFTGEESLYELSPSLALMHSFMSIQINPYTDVQKREMRLILKEIKKRGKA